MSEEQVTNGVGLAEVVRIRVSRDKLKQAVTSLTGERDTARSEVTRLTAENQKLAQAADTGASQKRVKELEGELRGIRHQKVFETAAKKAGIQESAIEAAWKLSGYTPEGEPDADKIGEVVTGLKTSSPFLFGQPATEVDPNAPTRPNQAAAGSGKGGPAPDAKVREDLLNAIIPTGDRRLSDAKWQMENQDALVASARARIALKKFDPILMEGSTS